ncbi:hypothetical protein [Actomonas aquatica]|uniref:Uncharacterized protein n=1 Tax=Actomonas aquatica TaxID=2866162 RepID=A0ABZ1C6V4_9BACT|nr:hypothetical protein [Opitutus sp. WL0086]WRQ87067.1 hypothetical protein K1X11_019810 [Opitutus sp. WL0086]
MPASFRLPRLLVLAAGLCAATLSLTAQGWTPSADFLARLSDDEELATGVHELTEQERANLDNLVAYEVASARAGNVSGFAGTFSSRRSTAELDATGIDRLSDEQRERLDQHIAGYIADTPTVPYISRRDRNRARTTGDSAADAVESEGPRLEVHGSVTLEVGSVGGETYYGGEVTTVISDPKGRFQAAISYGTSRGGLPYYYDPRYDLRRDRGLLPPRR